MFLVRIIFGLTATLTTNALSSSKYSPIILIPGDGGNQLEARQNPSAGHCVNGEECRLSKSCRNSGESIGPWSRLWLDVWQLRSSKLGCWADTIRLVYDRDSRKSHNVAGVETRVQGWGNTDSVEYLDPSWSAWVIGDVGNYMSDFVKYFVSQGYVRGKTIRAAPYDFRFGPQSQQHYFEKLRMLVEETYLRSGSLKVSLVTHSMGGLLGLYFLQSQTREWLQQYVHSFVPLNTPWRGAVIQLNTYASGYNMGIDMIDPLVIRGEQRSYETGVYIMPLEHTWNDTSQVLVETPRRNYTVKDYKKFFDDIRFSQGMEMMENVVNFVNLTHPAVNTFCVYSFGVETPEKLIYDSGFPDAQPERIMGDGDGTVTRGSLEACHYFLNQKSDKIRSFKNINHGNILKHKDVLKYIKSIVMM